MNDSLTLGSLFDGIGGFPLAGVRQGFTPVWASEIEPFPIEVTKIRFPKMLHVMFTGVSVTTVPVSMSLTRSLTGSFLLPEFATPAMPVAVSTNAGSQTILPLRRRWRPMTVTDVVLLDVAATGGAPAIFANPLDRVVPDTTPIG